MLGSFCDASSRGDIRDPTQVREHPGDRRKRATARRTRDAAWIGRYRFVAAALLRGERFFGRGVQPHPRSAPKRESPAEAGLSVLLQLGARLRGCDNPLPAPSMMVVFVYRFRDGLPISGFALAEMAPTWAISFVVVLHAFGACA
jgi:hypothetical protein